MTAPQGSHSVKMPTIEVPNTIRIGQALDITLRNSANARDCHIVQNHILLPEVITLDPDEHFHYFPEAPGYYTIQGSDCAGSFHVTVDLEVDSGPVLARGMWFPSAWTAAVGAGHESGLIARLPEFVQPGAVVFDIGANIGLYSIRFVDLVDDSGCVYCFEPSPLALHYLSHNLGVKGGNNYLILPLAIADRSDSMEFVLNPDNHGLGSIIPAKRGIKIRVDTITLDEAVTRFSLRPPDLIKMDVEGGEILAIDGMRDTIETHLPTLIFELHGRDAARATLKNLRSYDWQIPAEDRHYSAGELADAFPDACLQVIGVARRKRLDQQEVSSARGNGKL